MFFIHSGIELNFLEYHNVVHAIKIGLRNHGIRAENLELFPRPRPTLLSSIVTKQMKGCQTFYKILMSKQYLQFNTRKIEEKWHLELNRTYDVNTWETFKYSYGGIKYHNYLKWLQIRILRRCLHLNVISSKYRQEVRNICEFCNNEPETISHFFYLCPIVQNLHEGFRTFLSNININLTINLKTSLFGILQKSSMSMDNLVLLYIRGFLWYSKNKKVTPTLRGLKCYILVCVKNLKFVYCRINQEMKFDEWQPIYDKLLLEEGGAPDHDGTY